MRATFRRYLPLIGAACGILSPCALGDTLLVPSQYATIQAGIDAAVAGDTVLVADGIYTGTGNKNLDFKGKAITVRSASGDPALCIIDCQGSGRGFYLHTGETAASVIAGFSIRNGRAGPSPILSGCGAGVCCDVASPTLAHCSITGNVAATSGGGVYCSSSTLTLADCHIAGNTALGAYVPPFSVGGGGGVCCDDSSSPILINCTITSNTTNGAGGGVASSSSNPTLINCAISANTATLGGGLHVSDCFFYCATLLNCTIAANTASADGGGAYLDSAHPQFTNCVISGNGAANGGGAVYCRAASLELTGCTISGNAAAPSSAGIYLFDSGGELVNCILWANAPREIRDNRPFPPPRFSVHYCDVQGGYAAIGNINADPLFVDPNGPDNDPNTWADNDYRLRASSPCIDAGYNPLVPPDTLDLDADGDTAEPLPFDLAGNPRFVDDPYTADTGYPGNPPWPVVDMGAYEVQFLRGDANCDGGVNVDDISPFVRALIGQDTYEAKYPGCPWLNGDCNGDGTVNFDDINPFVRCLVAGGCP